MTCECNVTIGNTGLPNCQPVQAVSKKLLLVSTFANDGSKNGIDISVPVDQTFLHGKLNEADQSKRWYPTANLSNVADVRELPATEDIDGISYHVENQGVRNFSAQMVQVGYGYLSKLAAGSCANLSFYAVDDNGVLWGELSADGTTLYPIAIEKGTFNVRPVPATRTTVPRLEMVFVISKLVLDTRLDGISVEADLLEAEGIVDVRAEASAISTTGFTLKLTDDYGFANSRGNVTGLLLADFSIYNATQAAAVVPTSVDETVDGTYAFVFAAQNPADVLSVSIGKEYYELNINVLIP